MINGKIQIQKFKNKIQFYLGEILFKVKLNYFQHIINISLLELFNGYNFDMTINQTTNSTTALSLVNQLSMSQQNISSTSILGVSAEK